MVFEAVDGSWHTLYILQGLEFSVLDIISILNDINQQASTALERTYQSVRASKYCHHSGPPVGLASSRGRSCFCGLGSKRAGISQSYVARIPV
jgi:hypothetical protein